MRKTRAFLYFNQETLRFDYGYVPPLSEEVLGYKFISKIMIEKEGGISKLMSDLNNYNKV